jgi:RNA polymerase I-specific transcription initiation factor RRN3
MLYNIVRLIPKSASDVFPIIASGFPFYSWNKEILVWYVAQCLRVQEYLPSIRQQFLELLIDRCLEIDVNIFIKDNGDATIDEEEHRHGGIVEKEEQQEPDGREEKDDVLALKAATKEAEQQEIVKELSDKLDALLKQLFDHLRSRCNKGTDSARQTFYELLPIFESSILTTHKSKFVQYCMFLVCGLEAEIESTPAGGGGISTQIGAHQDHVDDLAEEPILNREFASALLNVIVDPNRSTTTRQSAACYLASFISRATYVGPETVCESVSALLRWAEAYISSLVGSYAVRAADARTQSDFHSLFYTVCQAAFYIMSFQGRGAIKFYRETVAKHSATHADRMSTDDEHTIDAESINLSKERWTYICGHGLQPLRFCLESVRTEFLHVAHFFGLIEESVYDKLANESNRLSSGKIKRKRASKICTAATLERRRENGGVGGLGRGKNPLKSFFPFDPLLLEQSYDDIKPFYMEWGGPIEEDDDEIEIDEIQQDEEEPAFEMDETMEALDGAAHEEDQQDTDDGDGDEEEDDDDDDDGEEDDDESATDISDRDEDDVYCTPTASHHKLLQQKAWTETLKRPRSFSMENGSW